MLRHSEALAACLRSPVPSMLGQRTEDGLDTPSRCELCPKMSYISILPARPCFRDSKRFCRRRAFPARYECCETHTPACSCGLHSLYKWVLCRLALNSIMLHRFHSSPAHVCSGLRGVGVVCLAVNTRKTRLKRSVRYCEDEVRHR